MMGNFWPLNLKTWDEMDIFLEKYNIPGSTKEKIIKELDQ